MAALTALASPLAARAALPELRVLTHSSFNLPKPVLADFERQAGVRLVLMKAGDAGEMLNRLILSRARPVADVVFGIDNSLAPKAQAADVIDRYDGPAARRPALAEVGAGLVPVTRGFVNLNVDVAWLRREGRQAPIRLEDLAQPDWRGCLVVPNPATSSPGLAFLLATLERLGEEAAFDWWQRLRGNGLKVVKGWTEAYYTEFSRNGGTRPLVVSYASSPAAELFYAKDKQAPAPTANLWLKGAVYQQVEGVALVRGGGQREAAGRFIEFMRSPQVQQGLQTEMWMWPVEPDAGVVPALASVKLPESPASGRSASAQAVARSVARWTRTVLK